MAACYNIQDVGIPNAFSELSTQDSTGFHISLVRCSCSPSHHIRCFIQTICQGSYESSSKIKFAPK